MVTKKKLKIAIISHAFVVPVNQNRWRRLAKDNNYEVHLIIPKYWKSSWLKEEIIYKPQEVHNDNFHVHPLPTTNVYDWSKYLFKSFDGKFRKINPDLIYIIHEESILIHHQIYFYKKLFAPKAKVIFFSMNARGLPYQKAKNPIKRILHKLMWKNIKKNSDAALVHYPGCLNSLRSGNYNKPIYMQTQIGVDETIFAPNKKLREKIRKELDFEDKLVVGYAGRLTEDKGVDDIAEVFMELSKLKKDLALLLVGNGNIKKELESTFQKHNLQDKVHITGFVDHNKVPAYMNAMDIFALGSKTTSHWLDTFPLVTVQAQAVGVPVIASDSASLPWQLADSAKIFHEGNRVELKKALTKLIENPELRDEYAQKGRIRSLKNFCHEGMTENFKKITNQIIHDKIIYHKEGEKYTQWKAY